jgi:tetratricopeptide (TPR) repeat protein
VKSGRSVTQEFYKNSFEAADLLHLGVLRTRLEAGRFLEMGVLADIKGEPAGELLQKALERLKESRRLMDALYNKFGDMRKIEQNNKALPEHTAALDRILKAIPPVERVSLVNNRFANVSQGRDVVTNLRPVGKNFDDMLANMQSDLLILEKEYDQTIEAFEAVIPAAQKGGFAAIVLSGRAPLPEKIMHSIDQTMVYVHSVDRACQASIAADMQVYPKGLEWLPKANWKGGEQH